METRENCKKFEPNSKMKFLLKLIFLLILLLLKISFSVGGKIESSTNLVKDYHKGDLIIQGNEVFTIDGKEFTMSDGNVYIYDNGKLIIKNSSFIFLTEYHAERKWVIKNYGRVEIINSEIHTPNKSGTIPASEVVTTFHDNSSLYIDNSIVNGLELIGMNNSRMYINKSKIPDVLFPLGEWYEPVPGETSEIEVCDSDVHIICLTFPPGSITSLQGLKEGLMNYFELSGEGLGYHIILINTNVFSLELLLEMNANLTIRDSNFHSLYIKNSTDLRIFNSELIDGIGILLREGDITHTVWIKDLEAGYFDYLDFNNHASGHNFTLILNNTRLNSWMINPHGMNLILENSRDIILRPWGWGTYVNVKVINCHLLEQWFDTFFGMITYENSIIDKWSNTWECDFDFKGEVEIIDASDIVNQENGLCRNMIIRREFPVKTEPNVKLEVLDSNNNLIWTGYADENGEAYFSLDFDCSNYENEYILRAIDLNREIIFKLGSSTPLKIEEPANIFLSPTSLNFGASITGSSTSSQYFRIENAGGGTLNWSLSCDSNWLSFIPASGTGDGKVTVSVDPKGLSSGTYTATITVYSPEALNSPQYVTITLKVYEPWQEGGPFGVFDTPVDGSTVSGNIPVTGWALDDVEVTKVEIKRA
ncbi:MAG: BACON domain-containing protein, partial [Candidatus Helarchaeota archaeon]